MHICIYIYIYMFICWYICIYIYIQLYTQADNVLDRRIEGRRCSGRSIRGSSTTSAIGMRSVTPTWAVHREVQGFRVQGSGMKGQTVTPSGRICAQITQHGLACSLMCARHASYQTRVCAHECAYSTSRPRVLACVCTARIWPEPCVCAEVCKFHMTV